MAPNMPKPTSTPSTVDIEKTRELNRRSGMIASSPMARSIRMKATSPTAPMM